MTNQYILSRIVGRDPDLRASDAERERIADRLRKSHAEGRLDLAEFQERLEQCYAAKTLGELSQLVRDLPRQPEQDDPPSFAWLRPWSWRLAPLAPILLGLLILSALAGQHVFWLWIPLVFFCWRMSWRRRWVGARRGPHDWI
jgi:hypothetical protein